MLKFLSKLNYFKVFFSVISIPAIIWLCVDTWQNDVATAKNGVVQLDLGVYLFGSLTILLMSFLLISVVDSIFDLGFYEEEDKIQQYFQQRLYVKSYQETLDAWEARDLALKDKMEKEKEDMELKQFISDCLVKGKAK